jgi:hypothetical protein
MANGLIPKKLKLPVAAPSGPGKSVCGRGEDQVPSGLAPILWCVGAILSRRAAIERMGQKTTFTVAKCDNTFVPDLTLGTADKIRYSATLENSTACTF